jgi:hypothetical protein
MRGTRHDRSRRDVPWGPLGGGAPPRALVPAQPGASVHALRGGPAARVDLVTLDSCRGRGAPRTRHLSRLYHHAPHLQIRGSWRWTLTRDRAPENAPHVQRAQDLPSEQAAIRGCHAFGRHIIDGLVPQCSMEAPIRPVIQQRRLFYRGRMFHFVSWPSGRPEAGAGRHGGCVVVESGGTRWRSRRSTPTGMRRSRARVHGLARRARVPSRRREPGS